MTGGKYLVYSKASLNPEKDPARKAHTVLLKDAKRGKLVLGFEDVLRDQGSDQDFNDVVFYITASPYSSVHTDEVISITPAEPTPPIPPTTGNNNPGNNNSTPGNNTNTPGNNTINVTTTIANNTNNNPGGNSNTTNNNTVNNNVNTGTSNNTTNNTNSNNTTTNNNTTTTVINNTTIINNTNGNNGNSGGNNGNSNNGGNNGNSNNNNNTVASSVTVCNRNGLALDAFAKLKNTLKAQYVESNKPMIIKQAVASKKVTVSQVKELIRLISVEQYKLDMAKYLFDFTCDKSNYFEINALLNASRARELDAFLKNKNLEDDNVTSVNTTVTNTDNTGTRENSGDYRVNNNATPQGVLCENGRMPLDEFDDIKESIDSKSFSDTKMTVLKEAMPTRCISAVQVREIVKLFSFETDKINVAKYLYRYTTDKQNYYKVNDAFSFSSSIDELKTYINSGR